MRVIGSGLRGAVLLLVMVIVSAVTARDLLAAEHRVADAVKARDAVALKTLLKQGADVNGQQPDGATALHWAAYWDDLATVQLLLGAGAKADVANRYGVTPLIMACTNASSAIAETLLKGGANANATSGEGEPVLLTAARTGSAETVKVLLGHGASVRAVEAWHQQTALMWAAAANGPAAVQTLIDAGADLAAKAEGGYTALHFAARAGAIDATKVLLAAGADIGALTTGAASPLMLGVINARYELAALLLDKGADPNDSHLGYTPLHQLVWSYHPNVVFNPPGPEKAVKTGNLDAMGLARALLEHKADPNARMTKNPPDGYRTSMNRNGATPLMMAARVPDIELMRLLLDHGADPTLKTKDNTSLLMVAAGYGWQAGESPEAKPGAHMAAVKLALELGGDLWWANDRGYTALHCAVIRESNELIQFFVDLGADLYAETKEEDPRSPGVGKGKTPLGVSQGQMINASVKYYPVQEAFLRQIMGLPAPPRATEEPR